MAHFPPVYLTISRTVNAPRRLESLRARAANKNAPDWRTVRAWTFQNGRAAFADLSQGSNSDADGRNSRPVWYCHTGPQFRNEQFCDEVDGARIDHTGWFTRNDCGATIRGIVGSLTHGRFIAGYYSSDNGARVYFGDVYTDAKEAARAADSEAESMADKEREYNERWGAANDLSEEIDTLKTDIAELFPMRHHARARRELAAALDKLRDKSEELKNDYSDVEV